MSQTRAKACEPYLVLRDTLRSCEAHELSIGKYEAQLQRASEKEYIALCNIARPAHPTPFTVCLLTHRSILRVQGQEEGWVGGTGQGRHKGALMAAPSENLQYMGTGCQRHGPRQPEVRAEPPVVCAGKEGIDVK